MKAKQKAEYLYNLMYNQRQIGPEAAKQCALIAIDEMIAELAYIRTHNEEIDEKIDLEIDQRQDFLIQVEKEIKAL
jgi:hypothetical protein